MTQRPSVRISKALRVKVRGVDRNGQPFVQTARTKDISPKGARIEGLTCLHSAGQVIEVQRWWKRARFRANSPAPRRLRTLRRAPRRARRCR